MYSPMDVTFITRRILNPKTGKAKEWIVDAYIHNGKKMPNWYHAKTLKACKKQIANRNDL